jgi:hypothetical protein
MQSLADRSSITCELNLIEGSFGNSRTPLDEFIASLPTSPGAAQYPGVKIDVRPIHESNLPS